MSWWTDLGYPDFEDGKGGFPRTGQVVKYYRRKKMSDAGNTWTQERLAEVLDVTEKTIGEIENRDSFLDFDRRQRLCQLLAIPPLLLGIRTREDVLKLVEEHRAKKGVSLVSPAAPSSTLWWTELGYPAFAPGCDGLFPRTGQVIKHYRAQKKDQKGKPWTQRLLAQTLGLTDQAVWDLENKDIGLDFDRRQFLSDLFAIPAVLLGIITACEIDKMVQEHRAAHKTPPVVSTASRTSHRPLIDVQEYTALLEGDWTTFISDPTHLCMSKVDVRMDALYRELPHVRDKKPIEELLCRHHDFVVNVLRDQGKYDEASQHCHKARPFAKRLNRDELKALVLYELGSTLRPTDRLEEAREYYEKALRYEQRLPHNLRGCLLLDTGHAQAEAAQTKEQRREAIALVDRAADLLRGNWNEADPYFLNFNRDRYHLTRSASLIAVGRNRDALHELKLVKPSSLDLRRQALADIYQAQAHFNLGEYERVVDLAESGLVIVQAINSQVVIARVEKLSQQLKASPYKDSSDVARLEYRLRKR
jgi:transcriptional regulator with XRE-family HTH domain/tetratricopeptide (TPR) repeat protein